MQQVAFEQKFGVPLQAEKKWVRRKFDRFNDTIGRGCTGNKGAPDRFHRLVVRAVDLHADALDDAIEQAAGCDGDAVRESNRRCRLSVLQHMVDLGRNILIQAPSAGDIHALHASANGQRGDVVPDGQPHQVQFKAGASFSDDRKGISLFFSVQGWIQVRPASCQEESVDPFQQAPACGSVRHKWQNYRHAAEFLNGADIPGPQKICGLLAAPFLTITGIEVGGDSDDGFHASGSVPRAMEQVLAGCNRRPLAQVPLRRRGSGWVYRL